MDIQITVPAQVISISDTELMTKMPESDVVAYLTSKGYTVTKTVTPPPPPPPPPISPITIKTKALPIGMVGTPYSTVLEASSTGGSITSWKTVDSNGVQVDFPAPRPGLVWGGVNSQQPGLTITGTPTEAGTTSFRFKVTDAAGNSVITGPYSLAIDAVVLAPPPPPPPPPPSGKGRLIIGTSWATSNVDAAAKLAAVGVAAKDGAIVNNNNSISGFPGIKMFAEGAFKSGNAAKWTANANMCIAMGVNIIRGAWEFQTGNVSDSGGMSATAFISQWQSMYKAYSAAAVAKGLPADWFSFIWNPDKGNYGPNNPAPVLAYYPGKAYMGNPGIVGIDFYTTFSAPAGVGQITWVDANLQWCPKAMLALALQNGHEIAWPEWSNRPSQAMGDWGGPVADDAEFISASVDTAIDEVRKTGRNVYLMMWEWPSNNTIWQFSRNPKSVAMLKTKVDQYRKLGLTV